MITSSDLDRIVACPTSEILPQVKETNAYATNGQIIHDYLDAVNKHGREEALARSDEAHRILLAAIDTDKLPIGAAFRSEVAFAYDYATGEARELHITDRQYAALGPTEIAGTADVIAIHKNTVYVGDYKTGHLPPKPESMQLRAYGVMAARAFGVEHAICEIIVVREDGTIYRQRAEMDAFELAIAEQQIRDAVQKVESADPAVVTKGEHCRYCPAYRSCPATLALAREVAATPDMLGQQIRAALTPATAGLAFDRVKQLERLLKAVKEELAEYAKQHPFATGAGKTYGPRPWSTRKVDAAKALPVVAEILGPKVAEAVFPRSATLSAIEAAAKEAAVARGEKAAPFIRGVISALESAGAIAVEQTEQVREF